MEEPLSLEDETPINYDPREITIRLPTRFVLKVLAKIERHRQGTAAALRPDLSSFVLKGLFSLLYCPLFREVGQEDKRKRRGEEAKRRGGARR